jgi:ClpA/ClpB-like protein
MGQKMVDYELSINCARSLTFAMAVSELRKSVTVEVFDVLGAMYLVNREKGAKYWRDPQDFEELVTRQPGFGAAISSFESMGAKSAFRFALRSGEMHYKNWSRDRIDAVSVARELASRRTPSGRKPILTSEHLLLAATRNIENDVAQKLIQSGLDIKKLERAIDEAGTEGEVES